MLVALAALLALAMLAAACGRSSGSATESPDGEPITWRVEGGIAGRVLEELDLAPDGTGTWLTGEGTVPLVVSPSRVADLTTRLRSEGMGSVEPTPADPNLADGTTVTLTVGDQTVSWYGILEQPDRFRSEERSLVDAIRELTDRLDSAVTVDAAEPGPTRAGTEQAVRGLVFEGDGGTVRLCSGVDGEGRCSEPALSLLHLGEGARRMVHDLDPGSPLIAVGRPTPEGLDLA